MLQTTENKSDLYRQGQDYAVSLLSKNPSKDEIRDIIILCSKNPSWFNQGVIDYMEVYRHE